MRLTERGEAVLAIFIMVVGIAAICLTGYIQS